MTREKAKEYMWVVSRKNPQIRWGNHVSIRTHVDALIGKIYDDLGSCKTCEHVVAPNNLLFPNSLQCKKFKTDDLPGYCGHYAPKEAK